MARRHQNQKVLMYITCIMSSLLCSVAQQLLRHHPDKSARPHSFAFLLDVIRYERQQEECIAIPLYPLMSSELLLTNFDDHAHHVYLSDSNGVI